jgi:hypothetical protein
VGGPAIWIEIVSRIDDLILRGFAALAALVRDQR